MLNQINDAHISFFEFRRIRRRPDDIFLLELEHRVLSPVQQDTFHDFDLSDGLDQRNNVEFFLQLVSTDSVVCMLPEFGVAFDLDDEKTETYSEFVSDADATHEVLDDVQVAVLEVKSAENKMFEQVHDLEFAV